LVTLPHLVPRWNCPAPTHTQQRVHGILILFILFISKGSISCQEQKACQLPYCVCSSTAPPLCPQFSVSAAASSKKSIALFCVHCVGCGQPAPREIRLQRQTSFLIRHLILLTLIFLQKLQIFGQPFSVWRRGDSRQNIQFLTAIACVPFSMSLPTLLRIPDVPDTRHEWLAISRQLSFDVEIEVGWSYLYHRRMVSSIPSIQVLSKLASWHWLYRRARSPQSQMSSGQQIHPTEDMAGKVWRIQSTSLEANRATGYVS
jgi:hypothetical protein